MLPLDRRTAADMVREYQSGIHDIDRKILSLQAQFVRDRNPALSRHIFALESMRGDMMCALYYLRKYT